MIRRILSKSFLVVATLTFILSSKSAFSQSKNLNFTVDLCGRAVTDVRMVGPTFNNWDPTSGPAGVDNGDGTWGILVTTQSDTLVDDLEYLINVIDANGNHYESLVYAMQNGGTCAPITDYFSYASRVYVLNTADTIITYNRCSTCDLPDTLTIITEVCTPTTPTSTGFIKGSPWNWSNQYGLNGVNNGDGTFTFRLTPPQNDTIEYLLVIDGVQEDLIQAMLNGGTCAPSTDFATYANRRWTVASGDTIYNTFYQCTACPNGINEYEKLSTKIYPNPVVNVLNLESENMVEGLTITDVLGQKVYEKKFNKNKFEVNLSGFKSGLYLVHIESNNKIETQTIVIE